MKIYLQCFKYQKAIERRTVTMGKEKISYMGYY